MFSFVTAHSPHIAGVTETWLNEHIYDSEITLPGFTVVRTDIRHGRGGGVALFLRSDLKFSVIPSPPDTESVWCKVFFGSISIVFGVVYRSPSSNIDQLLALTTFMQERFLSTSSLICLGDFNTPGILWPSLSLTGYDVEISKVLLDFSLYFCLKHC